MKKTVISLPSCLFVSWLIGLLDEPGFWDGDRLPASTLIKKDSGDQQYPRIKSCEKNGDACGMPGKRRPCWGWYYSRILTQTL
jgi:hypothetical protein